MLIGLLVLLTLLVVFAAGEAVRGQCRRMLSVPAPMQVEAVGVAPSEALAP